MAAVTLNPGLTEIVHAAAVNVNSVPPQATEAPGGLYPMVARAFEMDEYRIMAGWPVPVPPVDIRSETLCSTDGELLADRDDPTGVLTGALIRWVADPTLYDETALVWRPAQNSTGTVINWTTSVSYAPTLINDYQYRVGDERFTHNALNFDSDSSQHMWADFTPTIGGASGYTLIMVMSPNSTYGNNVGVPYNGIWSPGGATPVGSTFVEDPGSYWMSVTAQGYYLYLQTESSDRTRGISIQPGLNSSAPTMIAVVFDRPETFFYVGPGPSSIRVKSIPTGDTPVPLNNSYVLGRSTGDVLHTADMALLDLGLYADRLSATDVANEFAILSQVYGGDS